MTQIDMAMGDFAMDVSQTTALIAQLLRRTPGGKLSQSDIGEAMACVSELYLSAAMLELWKTGKIEFGWDTDDEQLILVDANSSEANSDGRLILRGND